MRLFFFPALAGLVLATLLTIHVLPQLASVLLLVFAGVILAVLLDALTSALRRLLPGGHTTAYAATLLCVIVVLVTIGLLISPQLSKQIPQLINRLPQAWNEIIAQLNNYVVLDSVTDKARQPLHWLFSNTQVLGLLTSTFGVLANILVVAFVGVYAAAAPKRYLQLGQHLLVGHRQEQFAGLANDLGCALRQWMLGRCSSMAIVGIATGIGLWLLGVPMAFTLGFLAGLLSFVPYIGPILGPNSGIVSCIRGIARAGGFGVSVVRRGSVDRNHPAYSAYSATCH